MSATSDNKFLKSLSLFFLGFIVILGVQYFTNPSPSSSQESFQPPSAEEKIQQFDAAVIEQNEEQIHQFEVSVNIEPNSDLKVNEKIVYDFGGGFKHGIYREIPLWYEENKNNSLKLENISVTDEKGIPYNFSLSGSGGSSRIKIGDPDKTITGVHTYVLSYAVRHAIQYYYSHDELNWNFIGNGWEVPILEAKAKLTWSFTAQSSSIEVECFYGPYYSDQSCNEYRTSEYNNGFVNGVNVVMPYALRPYEALTMLVNMPKGVVYEPTNLEKFLYFSENNLPLFIPIIVFLIMFLIWWHKGKDP